VRSLNWPLILFLTEFMCSLNAESMFLFVFFRFVFLGLFLAIIVFHSMVIIFMFKFDSCVEELPLHNLECRGNRAV
jgi:hypothetical protein